jgi:diacylglycerol kinase family enzyme
MSSTRPPGGQADGPFFIVFNIGSGHGDPQAARRLIDEAMNAAQRRYELLSVDDPSQLPELARAAVEKAQRENGIVVAAGGDGTINSVAQAVLESERPFGVLPQGTFNYFGRAHSISQEISESVQTLLTGRIKPVQVGLMNDRLFLVNASVGLYPRLLEDREKFKRRYGRHRIVALWSAAHTLLRSKRYWLLRIEDERGREATLQTPTLFVGNNALQLQQVGLPEAEAVEDGHLAGVALKPVSRWAMAGLLLHGALGRLGRAESVINFAFRDLRVQPVIQGRRHHRELKVAMDGEVCRLAPPLRFRVAPKQLQLITPVDRTEPA